jgi:hypothetical protein
LSYVFINVAKYYFISLPFICTGNLICNHNSITYWSMGRQKKIVTLETNIPEISQYAKNRAKFIDLEQYWSSVRLGYLKSLDGEIKLKIEQIYREELDQRWLPNRFCSGCYFNAIKELMHHFIL